MDRSHNARFRLFCAEMVHPEPNPTTPPSIGGCLATDAELLTRMKHGDRAALNEFLNRYESIIRARYRRKLGRVLRRVFDSEDLLATVRRRLDRYVAAGTLRADHEPQLWALIGTIADHAVSAQVRLLKRSAPPDATRRELVDLIYRSCRHDERLERKETVQSVLSELGRTEREIVVGSLRGVPQAEIGAELGLTEAAVRQRLYRVREGIRRTMVEQV